MNEPVFDVLPNATSVRPFDDDKYCGLVVEWSEKGTGWGSLTVWCDKATGEWKVDTETMGPDWCGRMLMRLQGSPNNPPPPPEDIGGIQRAGL